MTATRTGLVAFATGLAPFAGGEAIVGRETRAGTTFQRLAEEMASGPGRALARPPRDPLTHLRAGAEPSSVRAAN
jgi:hypothetical protein